MKHEGATVWLVIDELRPEDCLYKFQLTEVEVVGCLVPKLHSRLTTLYAQGERVSDTVWRIGAADCNRCGANSSDICCACGGGCIVNWKGCMG